MTGGSDTQSKLRAVFLAFVMVTSVFGATVAFSGTVAAGTNTVANSADLQSALDNLDRSDDTADTLILEDGRYTTGDVSLTIDETDDLTIRAADGATPVIDVQGSSETDTAIDITADTQVTIENVNITGQDNTDVISADGLSGSTTLTVQDSFINVSDNEGDAGDVFAIRTNGGGAIDLQNVNIRTVEADANGDPLQPASSGSEAAGIFAFEANSVTVSQSTFTELDFAVQTPDVGTVDIQDSSFDGFADEAIIVNTESNGGYAPTVTISGNNFTAIDEASNGDVGTILFLEDSGSFGSNADLNVNNNNFNDASGQGTIATDDNFDVTNGEVSLSNSVTVDAENNFFNSDLGPLVEKSDADNGEDVRAVPTSTYNNANTPAKIRDDGDIDFRPFRVEPAPDGASVNFNFDNNANQPTTDRRTIVNVTFAGDVNESSIDVFAKVDETGTNETLVRNGSVVADDRVTTLGNHTLDGSNGAFEQVSINTSVQEDNDLVIEASGKDNSGNDIFASSVEQVESSADVDMAGRAIRVIPDNSGPEVDTEGNGNTGNGESAVVRFVATDRFGNELTQTDGNVNAGKDDITVSSNDSGNLTIPTGGNGGDQLGLADTIDNNGQGSTTNFLVNDSTGPQVETTLTFGALRDGDFEITATDTGSAGSTLNSGSATQTFTAVPSGVDVTVNDTTLAADGSSAVAITAQIVDSNGDPVETSGQTVDFSLTNSTASEANIGTASVRSSGGSDSSFSDTLDTVQNGTVQATVTAQNGGFDIDVTAVGGGGSDSTNFSTTAGDVDAGNSDLTVGGQQELSGVQVTTDQTVLVDLQDAQSNPIEGRDVTLSSNSSDVSFASTALTTNASGQASTTVTLPEQKGTVAINASAGDFNASGTGNAQVNVSTQAENASALQFASDTRTLPANTEDVDVSVEVVDEFGNANESVTDPVTLTSSDASVFDFDGSESTQVALSSGAANFSVDVNESGTATLDATVADANITNTSADFSVGSPDGVEVTFSSDVSTSSNSATNGTATVTAQLTNDGDAIGIGGETISFARQSGEAAELNQSANDFEATTDSTGAATFQVNATDTTGDTTFLAIAGNFSAQGTGTITTTGAASTIDIAPANSTIASGNETTVTATFEDSQGRTVPRTSSITLQAGEGQVNGSPNTTEFVSGVAQATFTFNATNVSGGTEVTLTAVGGGVTGDATVTIEAADDQPVAAVTFDDKTVQNGTEEVTVESANFTRADGSAGDYVVVVHVVNATEFDGGVDNSISAPVGASGNLSNGAENITVDLNRSAAFEDGDELDRLTENVTLRAMLHTTDNESAFGSRLGVAIDGLERGDETDDANITVQEEAGVPEDPAERALQAAGVNNASAIEQSDITRLITLRDRGDPANGVDLTQDDITNLITLRDRAQ